MYRFILDRPKHNGLAADNRSWNVIGFINKATISPHSSNLVVNSCELYT